eukprot:EG_transcript_13148
MAGRAKRPSAKGLHDWYATHCRGKKTPPPPRRIPMSEVMQHNTSDSFWMVLKGAVYDITEFQHYHPGGIDIMLPAAGEDGTALFQQYHKWVNAESLLEAVMLGYVIADAEPKLATNLESSMASMAVGESQDVGPAKAPGDGPVLVPTKFTDFRVQKRVSLTADTVLLRLQAPTTGPLHVPVCGHVHIAATDEDGRRTHRPYSPIAVGEGWMEVLVKKYPGGVVSSYLHALDPGDVLQCRGPFAPPFVFSADQYRHIAILAAGTGITPFISLMNAALRQSPTCRVTLVACSRTEKDILLSQYLAQIMADHPKRFKVHHVISQPETPNELMARGRLDARHLLAFLPPPAADVHVLVCGPPAFNMHGRRLALDAGHAPQAITCLA